MAEVFLPPTLPPLFQGMPRKVECGAATVDGALNVLERRWPGLRDRLCDASGSVRPHIQIYVDSAPATLETTLAPDSRVDVIAAISGG